MAERDDFKRGYWSPVEIPTRMQIYFLLIFVYKLTSTNSYMLLRLYQCVHFLCDFCTNSYIFYTNCIVRIHTTSREGEARAHLLPRPGRTRLPRPLGYAQLPRPVRVHSWGGWVRNGIKNNGRFAPSLIPAKPETP
jgi:hypothetical protein